MSRRGFANSSLEFSADDKLQPTAFGLGGRKLVLELAEDDCSLDDARIERRIVRAQGLHRAHSSQSAFDPRDQHFKVEGLQDHIVRAGVNYRFTGDAGPAGGGAMARWLPSPPKSGWAG